MKIIKNPEVMVLSKVAILTDSNSGLTKEQAQELGAFVLPMPFMINGEEYFEGVNLTQEKFYEILSTDSADVSTSQPSMGSVINEWNELLQDYDEIVHIPMSSGLSSSYSTAKMLSEDYENVEVVNNQRISVTQRASVIDAVYLANEEGYSAKQIKEYLEKVKFESSIYIMLDTLKYLKKGGRITPTAAALGTILRIKPVLQIQGEKLDQFAKARTINQAKTLMIDAVKNDIDTRFGGNPNDVSLAIAHTNNIEAAKAFREEVNKVFPEHDIYIDHLSLSVSCHIGPGALALACSKKILLD